MLVPKYFCDKCKKEIKEYMLEKNGVTIKGDILCREYKTDIDLCDECLEKLKQSLVKVDLTK